MLQAEPPSGAGGADADTAQRDLFKRVRRFIAFANSKRETELRFVPSAREECATFHHDTVFLWLIVSEPQQGEHLVHRVLHNAFDFRLR